MSKQVDHVTAVSILIFGSKYPPATLVCNADGINRAIDYVATNVDDATDEATTEAILAKFKQAAAYYMRKPVVGIMHTGDLNDTLTALSALCVMLYEVDPQYNQLTTRIHTLMQDGQNLFNFEAAFTAPMMPRRGELGYTSDDDDLITPRETPNMPPSHMRDNDELLTAEEFMADYADYYSDDDIIDSDDD
ncbi:hypothetical protein F-LCD7_0177 [Faustovirus]|nr:hypothetical protein F-LCD7_0177 [Faustovirus]